jgi:hypothetical protein
MASPEAVHFQHSMFILTPVVALESNANGVNKGMISASTQAVFMLD